MEKVVEPESPPENKAFFLWRACQNRLPTRTRLQQKRVDAIDVCVFCEAVGELKEHVFAYCSFAKCCWQELGIGVRLTLDCDLQDWFFNLFYLVDEYLISKAAATLCMLEAVCLCGTRLLLCFI